MGPRSLRNKLLLAVSTLVITSGLLISLVVTQRYSKSLIGAAAAEAQHISHALALEATDKILTNDLVALQKLLDSQGDTNSSIAYLFVLRDGQVLSHTFTGGLPFELIDANQVQSDSRGHLKQIVSTKGDRFLDIAWPIFSGKAGVLRLGVSEKPYRQQVFSLGLQMVLITLGILLVALAVSFFFIRRVTRPLKDLAQAFENVDEENLGIRIEPRGDDEIGKLTAAFNHMVYRIKDYTRRLEKNTIDLDRAHRQTRSTFSIIQEIGAQATLREVSIYLIRKFQKIVSCSELVLFIFSSNRENMFTFSEKDTHTWKRSSFEADIIALSETAGIMFKKKSGFKSSMILENFQSVNRLALFPIHYENQILGNLFVACPGDCRCDTKELEIIDLILKQTSGAIKRAAMHEEEIRELQSRVEATMEFSGIVGRDPKMQTVYKLIDDIAPTDATVFIQGESGTGKELVARAIHDKSYRHDKPFIVINCSAYPATLLESELFGHEKGAFTGAIRQKPGRFEQAHGGTIFLDEIGEIHPSAQIKLLRVLQTQKFERVGGEQTLEVDVRILSATNKDLLQQVKKGDFREDLFYRLNVIPIQLPPLRRRRNDIPILARHFLRRFAEEQNKKAQGFRTEAMRLLLDYPWPGNVRELENSIEHAVLLAKGELVEVSDLPALLRSLQGSEAAAITSRSTIVENEARLLKEVLDECEWNKKEAARRLGISRSTLYGKLKKYQITPTIH